MKSSKGCWTCVARRVQCDGGLPTCQKCARAQRRCQGYGMRLSWPRKGDKRRAMTADSPPATLLPGQNANLPFINTTGRDMELYSHLALRIQPLRPVRTAPDLWKQPQLGVSNMDLVNHFRDSAYLSLVTFDLDTSHVRDALIRMSLVNDTVSGLALFYALLAFSSLHHSGLNQPAVQLKISALHYLSTFSKKGPLTSTEAAQHVAASMLLGAFDTLVPSASSGEWLYYTQGAMDIIQGTCLKSRFCESDIGHLLDWVYYHDALSRFPMNHWQNESLARDVPDTDCHESAGIRQPPLARQRPLLPSPKPRFAILNLLSETCDTLLDPRDPRTHSEEYRQRLKALERRIGNAPITLEAAGSSDDAKIEAEIWQMATHVYFVRASQSPWEPPASLGSVLDMVLAGPVQACSCPHFFPIFILACEARADKQRAAILSLISRIEKSERVRSIPWLRDAIQSIWAHQDLHADGDLLVDYVGVMSAVISSSNTVPSFV